MHSTKTALRNNIRAIRAQILPKERHLYSENITQLLLHRPEINSANILCMYASLPDEVNTLPLIETLVKRKKIVVPRIFPGGALALHRITSITQLTPGLFGVLEPKDTFSHEESVGSVDVFIVPGLVFDRRGYRLGWGKGYYDRLLKSVKVSKIGLAFSCQVVARVPHTSYDISMTQIITEKEVIICQKTGR